MGRQDEVTKFRVVHLLSGDELWGVETYAINLIRHLRALKVESMVVASRDGDLVNSLRAAEIPVVIAPLDNYLSLVSARAIVKIVVEFHASIIHVHMGVDSFLAVFPGLWTGCLIVKTDHSLAPAYMSRNAIVREAWRRVQILKNLAIGHFLPVSQTVADRLVIREGVPRSKITVVTPGIELDFPVSSAERQLSRKALGIGDDRPVIVSVGRLSHEKGMDIAIKAVAMAVK